LPFSKKVIIFRLLFYSPNDRLDTRKTATGVALKFQLELCRVISFYETIFLVIINTKKDFIIGTFHNYFKTSEGSL